MKKLVSILLALIMCFSITACGSKSDTADPDASKISADGADGVSDVKDLKTGKNFTTHNGAIVLHPDSELEMDGEYRIDSMYTEILTDRAIDREWEYYYVDSGDDGAPIITWTPSEGNFTSIILLFDCTNIGDKPCKFGDMAKMKIVFDEGGDERVLEATTLQCNPHQTFEDGYETVRSTEFADIEKDETTVVHFVVDVDRATHDALVADEIKEPTWAYIDFTNGEKYCVNLREDMIIFGYDDSDDESQITTDVFRTMKAATGEEFMEEFLRKSPDFMEIVDKSGIDVKEFAERFASLFSIKVTDIYFDSDTSATAYCELTEPDFVQMYKNLDKLRDEQFAGLDKSKITEEEFYQKMAQLMLDYTQDENFPLETSELELHYNYDEATETWILKDKDNVENLMRVALIDF